MIDLLKRWLENEKKFEIYLNDEIILSVLVEDYEINTFTNSFDVECTIKEIKITYSIPLNKGYKIVADI